MRAMGAMMLLLVAANASHAQRRRGGGYGAYFGGPDDMYTPPAFHGNVPYDGRFFRAHPVSRLRALGGP